MLIGYNWMEHARPSTTSVTSTIHHGALHHPEADLMVQIELSSTINGFTFIILTLRRWIWIAISSPHLALRSIELHQPHSTYSYFKKVDLDCLAL